MCGSSTDKRVMWQHYYFINLPTFSLLTFISVLDFYTYAGILWLAILNISYKLKKQFYTFIIYFECETENFLLMWYTNFPVSTFIEGLMTAHIYSWNMQTWTKLIKTSTVRNCFDIYICSPLTPMGTCHLKKKKNPVTLLTSLNSSSLVWFYEPYKKFNMLISTLRLLPYTASYSDILIPT